MQTPSDEIVLERLRQLIQGRVDVDPSSIQAKTRLTDLGIDSFALIELVFQVEEEFGITIPMEGLDVKTVSDVVAVVRERLPNLPQSN